MLEQNLRAQVPIPVAISLAFGLLFATLLTLLLVPAVHVIIEDVRALAQVPIK